METFPDYDILLLFLQVDVINKFQALCCIFQNKELIGYMRGTFCCFTLYIVLENKHLFS